MIGDAYKSKAVQAVLGPGHSALIPATLWSGWLDSSLAVVGMTGLSVSHNDFGDVTDGVANIDDIDGGLFDDAWTVAYFGLFDAASGGDLIAYAAVTFDTAPADGDSITISAGDLTFTYAEA